MNELEIHDAAIEIPDPEARRRFLDEACGGDAALRDQVEKMLAVNESSPDPGPKSPMVPGPSGPRHFDPLLGQTVGGVKLVRVIGEGGMGRVYEGRQESPRRTVAVKLVKEEEVTPKRLRKLKDEAQTLARLRHPGIAEIYFSGTFGEGHETRPFFVMEYVPNAKSLTEYADDLQLSTKDRLKLFQKACDAVAHGHMKGITHRDLKPGNILVDASGQPKIIDFGIAKSPDAEVASSSVSHTVDYGKHIGTYPYMSPEQIDADPTAIDHRSDVYSLGVVLYELLSGRRPHNLTNKSTDEMCRIIKYEDPTPLTSLDKRIPRDIGVIVGKCLEKSQSNRYSGAAELAADLGRHLAGDPIAAVPPSSWDSVARLAKRHRAAAIAVMAIAASLIVAFVGISAFAFRAEHAKRDADDQRDSANRAWKAEAEQRDRAEQETARAKRQVYLSNLYRLQASLDLPGQPLANTFVLETASSYRDAYGESLPDPIELMVLRPALDQAINVLKGHGMYVASVAFSPDGTRVATASWDHTVRLWDAESGKELRAFKGHGREVSSVAFSPDGKRLATGAGDNTARLWDVETGEELAVLKAHQRPRPYGDLFPSVAFSPDGTRLATESQDRTARLWDVATGKELAVLHGHSQIVLCIAFSPDGTRVATGSFDSTARLWEAKTGRELEVLKGHAQPVRSVAFSPDGTRLATGSWDRTARLWDAATGKERAVLTGHDEPIDSVAFSPNGTQLATVSQDRTARLWDAATGKELAVLKGHGEPIDSVAYSPDGMRLATGSWDHTARLWDAVIGNELTLLKGHNKGVDSIAFSPDGRRLATGSQDRTARLWDVATGRALAVLKGHEKGVDFVAFSTDGTRLATGSWDHTVRLWEAATGAELAVLKGHRERIQSVAFSPDGTRLATGARDKTARVWDAANGKELIVLKGHESEVMSVAFSPDGKRLATGAGNWDKATGPSDNTARLWDVATGEELAMLKGHEERIESVAFSPDGSQLSTVSQDRTARLWDAAAGRERALLKGHDSWVTSVAFSPDGTRLATGSWDHTARLWDAATGKTVAVLKGHTREVTSVAFSPDGTRLATDSPDNTARLWDAATGKELAVLKGNGKRVDSDGKRPAVFTPNGTPLPLAVAFSPDGMRLATGSWDHTTRIWGLSNADIYRNRLASAERRKRLAPLVDKWFAGDLAGVKERLAEAKAILSADDWHDASNMVLESPAADVVSLVRVPDLTVDQFRGIVASPTKPSSLNFWESPIRAEHFAAIRDMPSLTFLNLGSTGLHGRDVVRLNRFPKLAELHLEFLATNGDDLAVLRDCPLLNKLSLWKSTGSDAAARTALGLPRLRSLDLGSTGVSDTLFDGLEPNPSLQELRLDHTSVSDASVDALAGWVGLKSLDLTGARLSGDGLRRLREALPNCRVATNSTR